MELEQQVVVGWKATVAAWIHLAAYLHEMNAEHLHELLGYKTFNAGLVRQRSASVARTPMRLSIGSYVEIRNRARHRPVRDP